MSDLYLELSDLGVTLDLRHMGLSPEVIASSREALFGALDEMDALEAGARANGSEDRQVGHYWLRDPDLAPGDLSNAIAAAHEKRDEVARQVAARYSTLVHVGVGGSALGAQLLVDALGDQEPEVAFLDNLDPEGLTRVTDGVNLDDAAGVFVSKSGGTAEVEAGLAHMERACANRELHLAPRAVAITVEGSQLHERAVDDGWRATLPMWNWVGGRTSITSAAGLFTAQVAGVDVDAFLDGARGMDVCTRRRELTENPAALMALAWMHAQEDRPRAMVVLPYRDRLQLLGRYLQQLVMESLGKSTQRSGAKAPHGLTVYGNKGTTDQHALVQQLVGGPDDCFVTVVEVLAGLEGVELPSGVRAEDVLSGFAYGTADALRDAGRRTLGIVLDRLDARCLGALLALFERAVGLYASLHDLNAYDQPGVEAGKRAAADMIAIQLQLERRLGEGAQGDAAHFASLIASQEDPVFHVLRHLVATGRATSTGTGRARRFAGA